MRVIDLFSGMGGFSYGFKQSNFQIDQGIDSWDKALKSYSTYLKAPTKQIKIDEYFPTKKDFDLVIVGGSPCQDFSRLNTKRNIYSKRASLVLDYCRIIKAIQPEVFVFENVIGLAKWAETAIFELKGYKITKNIINSENFGIAQSRKRKIFIGSKKRTIEIKNPLIKSVKTVREVFNSIKDNWGFANHSKSTIEKFSKITSNSWISVSEKSNYEGVIRLTWDNPACAITNIKKAQILHPEENRVISIAEALGLQDFPNWYIPFGSDTDKAIQIANAIPPGVSKAIANKIIERI
ncbi:hypothetical protein LCGC14_2085480 [marine sediment metagenome]|uniref:DNA (cytosine-5-)-methyltransferase n=1 Tax=marine sediment metagenome TaxID=412755 RepID=A0A0F9F1M8_9ZZZZ